MNTANGVLGPTYLKGLTEHIEYPNNLMSHEWRRSLKSNSGQRLFFIKFYGELHDRYSNLIVGTAFAPPLIYAIDCQTNDKILLFDGCKHGYNAMFCDTYSNEQLNDRPLNDTYFDKNGNNIFSVIISTYNGIDYVNEFEDEIDEDGMIALRNGEKVNMKQVVRNGFDTLQIWAINPDGESINIVSQELA